MWFASPHVVIGSLTTTADCARALIPPRVGRVGIASAVHERTIGALSGLLDLV